MLTDPNRVKEIFLEATEKRDEPARAAYLDRACGGDAGLRDRVESLLRSHDPANSFLGSPAVKLPGLDTGATQEVGSAATPGDAHKADDDLAFLSPSTRPDSLGRLGHYEVLQVLGRGGFGIVFRAFDDILQRVVAVKVMAPQIATLSPARKRFLREARSSAAVRHENVVQVYEVGEQPLPYLAMEFIPGETLQQKLDRNGPLEVSEVLRIGRQIAEGLVAAHACDLIHRDIKPGNILLEGGAHKVKITDFGLARAADDASISQSGIIAGTPMFMAPEQALGHPIDQRADLFSLGSVLYQMASGRPPFRAPSKVAVLKRVAEESPRPIPETPDWLCGIIAKLHAKNPADRFQSAREVADLLADCEAKLKAKQEVKNILPAAVKPAAATASAGRKWVVATAVLLLPVIALAVMEFAGVTHLFRGPAPTPDPDRKAAECVLSIGGQVQVDDRDRTISAAAELPRDPFRLTWVGLMHSNQITDTGLANFKDCQNLTFLGLFDTSVSDEGLANFQKYTKLTFLNLSRTKISDAGLANFKNCKELMIVVLSETHVSDTGLSYLKNSKNLTKLFLQKTKVSAAGIDELKKALPLCKIEWDSGVSETPPLAVAPFDADKAKQHQEAWAKHLGVEPEITNSIGMKMRLVPPGHFIMGSPRDEANRNTDEELHDVTITMPFQIGVHEVTIGQFKAFVKEKDYRTDAEKNGGAVRLFADGTMKNDPQASWRNPGFEQAEDHPVVCVSWNDAAAFCKWLGAKEGKQYTLPAEAQWEYACRAGTQTPFSCGERAEDMIQYGWYNENSEKRTHPVGQKKPNAWGLFDMHGNAAEWVADCYGIDYYRMSPKEDPPGKKEGDTRVIRGGGWYNNLWNLRAARRYNQGNIPSRGGANNGFRVAIIGDRPSPVRLP